MGGFIMLILSVTGKYSVDGMSKKAVKRKEFNSNLVMIVDLQQ